MRFYDTNSPMDRRKALADISRNIKDGWSRLPKEWRTDKEFVIKVLELANHVSPAIEDDSRNRLFRGGGGDNDDASEDSNSEEEDIEYGENGHEKLFLEKMPSDDRFLEEFRNLHNMENNSCRNNNSDNNDDPYTTLRNCKLDPYMALPSKSDFERVFPRSLRFDRDVVLAWTKRPDFRELYRTRHLFLPPCFKHDKTVCLAYCRQIPRSLQDFHMDLCDDEEVVATAIEHCGGLELQYASLRIQSNEKMVRRACLLDAKALLFCPQTSDAFHKIVNDREFMLHVILGGTSCQTYRKNAAAGSLWKLLPPLVRQSDTELALAAFRNGLALRDIPKKILNIGFLKRALEDNSIHLYLQLSADWQSHPILALEAILAKDSTPEVQTKAWNLIKGYSSDTIEELVQKDRDLDVSSVFYKHFPLQDNSDVLMAVCKRGSKKLLRELLGDPVINSFGVSLRTTIRDRSAAADDRNHLNINDRNLIAADNNDGALVIAGDGVGNGRLDRNEAQRAPTSQFFNNERLMKLAVRKDPKLFEHIHPRLQRDVGVIMASIQNGTSALKRLKSVPWEIQRRNPQITLKGLIYCRRSGLSVLPRYIPDDIWADNRELRMVWIRRRGNIFQPFFPSIYTDEEMALQVAKYAPEEFHKVGHEFLSNRDFVLKALELNGRCLASVSHVFRIEFELVTTAAANFYNQYDTTDNYTSSNKKDQKPIMNIFWNLSELKTKIQRKLDLHDTFIFCFLRGIAISDSDSDQAASKLPMLDQGAETSEAYKRLIAEYLDVPLGNELTRLRKALSNIERSESIRAKLNPSLRESQAIVPQGILRHQHHRPPRRRNLQPQNLSMYERMVRQRVVVQEEGRQHEGTHQERVVNLIAEDLRRIRAGEPVDGL